MNFSWNDKNQLEKMDLQRKAAAGPIEIKLIFEPIDD
jgi:hypothetical protein